MNLTESQIEALYEIKRKGGVENVAIVDREAVNACRDALSRPLLDLGMREQAVESMSLESLSRAVTPDEDADGEPQDRPLTALSQMPETGGDDADDLADEADADDDPEGIEALTGEQVNLVRDKLRRAAIMEGRTPQYAYSLRAEAAEMVPGVESWEEIEISGDD